VQMFNVVMCVCILPATLCVHYYEMLLNVQTSRKPLESVER